MYLYLQEILAFYVGCCLASHAGVVSQRLYQCNFIWARSRCNNCHQNLALTDELPLFSYFLLKKKCRYCQQPIPATLPALELCGGCSFIFCDFAQASGLVTALFLFFFIVASCCDYQQQSYPSLLLLPLFYLAIWRKCLLPNLLAPSSYFSLIACSLLFLILIYRQEMGSGDFWLYLAIALAFSPQVALNCLLIASLSAFLILKKQETTTVAFLPFLYFSLLLQLGK